MDRIDDEQKEHIPGTVPEGAKFWLVGWYIEAVDGQGTPIKEPNDLRWAQCTGALGGLANMQRAAQVTSLSLSQHVDALIALGDLQELTGPDADEVASDGSK